jgi:hypothetical protein
MDLPPEQRKFQVMACAQHVKSEYKKVLERTLIKATLEFAVPTSERQLSHYVEEAVYGALVERAHFIHCTNFNDVFEQVLWPATKIRLAIALGFTCSVDDHFFQDFIIADVPSGAAEILPSGQVIDARKHVYGRGVGKRSHRKGRVGESHNKKRLNARTPRFIM